MTPQEQANLAFLMAALQNESMNYNNYNADAGNYNSGKKGILNYNSDQGNYQRDGILNIGGPTAAAWATNKIASANLSTYRVRIIYTPVAVVPAPVNIIMFASAYNTGTFVGGNLVFTNAGGDTATIQGMGSTTFQGMMNISETEPFHIEFLRIRPKSESQLENAIQAFENSQYSSGSFNEVTPDDYIAPVQFQLLRSDTPLGYTVGKRRGLKWTIDTDQTGKGIGMVMFVSASLDPSKMIANETPVRKFGPTTPFFTPQAPSGALDQMIAQKALMQMNGNNGQR